MIAIQIDIQHITRMIGLKVVWQRRVRRLMPTKWGELKPRHAAPLFTFLQKAESKDLQPDDCAAMVCAMCGLPEHYALLDELALNDALIKAATDWIEPIKHDTELRPRLLLMRGPGILLEELTYGQYLYAEACMQAYLSGHGDEYLRGLAAMAYQWPWSGKGERSAKVRSWWLRMVRKPTLLLCMLSYMGQRGRLPELYPELYKVRTGKGHTLRIDQQVMAYCGQELGGYNEVKRSPLHRVLELAQMKEVQLTKINPHHAKRNTTVEDLSAAARKHTREHNARVSQAALRSEG